MYKVDLILIRLNAHFVENTQHVFTTTKIGLFSLLIIAQKIAVVLVIGL